MCLHCTHNAINKASFCDAAVPTFMGSTAHYMHLRHFGIAHLQGLHEMPALMQVLHSVYSKFSKCQDNLPLALNEVYVCTVWGRWFFLPSIPGTRSKRSAAHAPACCMMIFSLPCRAQ